MPQVQQVEWEKEEGAFCVISLRLLGLEKPGDSALCHL